MSQTKYGRCLLYIIMLNFTHILLFLFGVYIHASEGVVLRLLRVTNIIICCFYFPLRHLCLASPECICEMSLEKGHLDKYISIWSGDTLSDDKSATPFLQNSGQCSSHHIWSFSVRICPKTLFHVTRNIISAYGPYSYDLLHIKDSVVCVCVCVCV